MLLLTHPSHRKSVARSLVVFCSFVVLCSLHGQPSTSALTRAAANNWPAYFGDASGTHFSQLKEITPSNVGRLQVTWTFHTGDASDTGRSQIQCNPIAIDGVLYCTSPELKLFALDAATGRELWRFDAFVNKNEEGGRGVNRGLTWWQEGAERRLLFSAGQYLHAVDPATGKLIESFGTRGRIDLLEGLDRETHGLYLAANTPGAIFRDLIIICTRVGEGPGPAAPGHIRAYDVRTGERRWIFHTIPHPGEFGYETWPSDAWKQTGGVNCWAGLVIDQERGIAYLPIGSAAFDFWGGDRIGNDLFANCLLALDAATGKRKWHFQLVHHDLWDRDPPAAPVLCEVIRGGKKIPAVAQTTKSGHVWVFNRETGESLFPWQEVPVPASDLAGETSSPTQPLPLKPAAFARQRFTEDEVTTRTPAAHEAILAQLRGARPHQPFDPPSERGTIILPGFDGGAEWGGAAVDPRGIMYVNASEMAWLLNMVPTGAGGDSHAPAALYAQLCMSCHGSQGAGNAAQNIPSLVAASQRLKSADVFALLSSSRGVMPSFGFLPEDDRHALADYVVAAGFKPTEKPRTDDPAAPQPIPAKRSTYAITGYNRLLDPDGFPALRPPWGTLNAIDLNTGEFVWKIPLGETLAPDSKTVLPTGTENYGGPIVTAGGVIFIAATKDEKIRAFDASTGKELWRANLPAAGFATPCTYSVGGHQYVVIACGGGKIGAKSGDAYVAFALPKN